MDTEIADPLQEDGPTCNEKTTFTIVEAEFDVVCGRAEHHATWSTSHIAQVSTEQGKVLFYWES